ncbi:MAG: DUF433 domain-containing protein [Mesorhizobium amorphae]|nr:MAG: DUF433 domain-containing protein [Mesorhizobium amorphae]
MKTRDILSCDPDIMGGAVVFRGTRVPVSALFENLAGGMSVEEFLDDFPTVERHQVDGALALATSLLEAEFA